MHLYKRLPYKHFVDNSTYRLNTFSYPDPSQIPNGSRGLCLETIPEDPESVSHDISLMMLHGNYRTNQIKDLFVSNQSHRVFVSKLRRIWVKLVKQCIKSLFFFRKGVSVCCMRIFLLCILEHLIVFHEEWVAFLYNCISLDFYLLSEMICPLWSLSIPAYSGPVFVV